MKVLTVTSDGGMNQFHSSSSNLLVKLRLIGFPLVSLHKHINEGSISLKIIVMNIVICNFTLKSLHPVLFTFHTVFQLFWDLSCSSVTIRKQEKEYFTHLFPVSCWYKHFQMCYLSFYTPQMASLEENRVIPRRYYISTRAGNEET